MAVFETLKRHENAGLCNVLIEVLSIRKTVKKHFVTIFSEEVKLMKSSVNVNVSNTEGLARIINSVSLVTAMCRLVEKYTELKLPFTYDEFFSIACEKVLKQVEMISTSNKLSNYFSTISFLLNQQSLQIGKELKVSIPRNGTVTVKTSGNSTKEVQLENPETKVLFLDFGAIYPLYSRAVKDPLSKASLQTYFNSNQAYIGLCKSTQFKWFNENLTPRWEKDIEGKETGIIRDDKQLKEQTVNTSAYMFNYTVLKELMDLDFERVSIHEVDPEAAALQDEKNLPF